MVVFVCFTRTNTLSCLCKLSWTGEECEVKTGKKLNWFLFVLQEQTNILLSWHPIVAEDAMDAVQLDYFRSSLQNSAIFCPNGSSSEERALMKLTA